MRQLFALIGTWFSREQGMCVAAIALCALVSAAPGIIDSSAPITFPQALSVPEVGHGLIVDPAKTADYRAARTIQSYRYLREIARGDGSMLWNPNEYAGTPFLAAWDTRVFSPFSLPYYLFDIRIAVHLAAILKVFFAGLFAYYVGRVLGLTQPFSLFVAVAHALSAVLVVWTMDPASDTAVWVPLLFLFAERLSLAQHRYWPTGALVIGVMLFSGAPQAVASSFVFFAMYFQFRRRVETVREFVAPLMAAVAAIGLGLALAAAQLWPYFEWLRHSAPVWSLGETGSGPRSLFLLFGPLMDASATPASSTPLHLGMIPIFLASLWVVVRGHVTDGPRRRIDAILIVSLIWLAAGMTVSTMQAALPAIQVVQVRQLVTPLPFALSLGGALTAEWWLQLRPGQSIEAAKRYVLVLGTLLVLGALSYFGATPRDAMAEILMRDGLTAALTVTVFVLVLGITLVRPWPRVMGYAFAVTTALQLLLFLIPVQAHTPWSSIFADPFEDASQRVTGRIAFGPGTESAGRLALSTATIQGFGPRAPKRMVAYLVRAQDDPLLLPRADVSAFVLNLDDVRGPYSNLRPQLRLEGVSDRGVGLFQYVPGAQPVRLLHEGRITDRFDPRELSSAEPPLLERDVTLTKPEGRIGRPLLRDDGRPTVRTINVYKTDAGVVELAESYYPGWIARVDESYAPVFPVDGAFRGVDTPKGAREILIEYRPASYKWGRVISFAALSVCLAGFAHLVYFRLRHQFFKL